MQRFLLGTYTRKESKGIYEVTLNREEKKLTDLQLIAEVENPTFLDTSHSGELLFSVLKEGQDNGGTISYRKNSDGVYQKVTASTQEGAAPCYVSYDEENGFLYSANYHKGEVALYRVTKDGELTLLDSSVHEGSSVHLNQDAPHAHFIGLDPEKQFLLACDLGTDEVITYQVSNERLVRKHTFHTPEGTGPRHLVFHPTLNLVYVLGELSSDVLVLSYNSQEGSLSVKQTLSMLPEDYKGENSGAAIRVSSDGRFLYASNRGHNSIVVYRIDSKTGLLESTQWQETFGETPRDFNLDETEQFVIAGHQDTPHLTLFERDKDKGTLTVLQKEFYAPEVVCVHGLLSN